MTVPCLYWNLIGRDTRKFDLVFQPDVLLLPALKEGRLNQSGQPLQRLRNVTPVRRTVGGVVLLRTLRDRLLKREQKATASSFISTIIATTTTISTTTVATNNIAQGYNRQHPLLQYQPFGETEVPTTQSFSSCIKTSFSIFFWNATLFFFLQLAAEAASATLKTPYTPNGPGVVNINPNITTNLPAIGMISSARAAGPLYEETPAVYGHAVKALVGSGGVGGVGGGVDSYTGLGTVPRAASAGYAMLGGGGAGIGGGVGGGVGGVFYPPEGESVVPGMQGWGQDGGISAAPAAAAAAAGLSFERRVAGGSIREGTAWPILSPDVSDVDLCSHVP